MMKPIFYKVKSNGECYKCVIMTENQSEIDIYLDAINPDTRDLITEKEFNDKYEKTMTLDIMTEDSSKKIGELTTKVLDDLEEDQLL